MKVVINTCFGGFSLSEEACAYLHITNPFTYDDDRTNPALIECVEKLGNAANGKYAKLKVVEIPDNIHWEIEYYDGIEHITEAHRTWTEYGLEWIGEPYDC